MLGEGNIAISGGDGSTLPDASTAEFNGAALVVKDGEWVISDIPVANKSEIIGINGRLDNIDSILEKPIVDWDEANETSVNAIANKPFGYVEGMVDVLPDNLYYLSHPNDTTTDIVCWPENMLGFEDNAEYYLEFNGIDLGQVQPNQAINI